VAEIADRIVVMYRGKVVEQGKVADIFKNPKHPYVKGLLACRPTLDCKYHTLPTVDDFLETKENDDGTIEVYENPEAEKRLRKLKSATTSENNSFSETNKNLVEVSGLKVYFRSSKGFLGGVKEEVQAVNGIDLKSKKGKLLG
jgi:peptide/nickel transport system ATP-binding protein